MDKFQVLLERLTGVAYFTKRMADSADVEIEGIVLLSEILMDARKIEDILAREKDIVKYVKALDGFLSYYQIEYPSDFDMIKVLLNSGNELHALEWLDGARTEIENQLAINLAVKVGASDLL